MARPAFRPVFAPFLLLYLATIMFYWWPLDLYGRPLWLAYASLFVLATLLNLASHKGSPDPLQES